MTIMTKSLVLLFSILALDQVTKFLALAYLTAEGSIPVTPFFNLVLVFNPGISFGLLQTIPYGKELLSLFTLGIVVWLLVWLKHSRTLLTSLALGGVIGGALGNLIDRFRYGAVVDFLDFHAASFHWPAFNVADSAIVIGACLLMLDALKGHHHATTGAGS